MPRITLPESLRERVRRVIERVTAWESTASSYLMILGSSVLLIVFGLAMVLSSSSVAALAADKSPLAEFYDQLIFAGIGAVAMFVAARLPVRSLRSLAWPAWGVGIVLLLLVFTPLGREVGGNRAWLQLVPGIQIQPGEVAKLALVLWAASVLANKRPLLGSWLHALVPMIPLGGLLIGLVVLGQDLGTAMVLMIIAAGMMFAAGVPMKMFAAVGGVMVVVATTAVASSENRRSRIAAWLGGDTGGTTDTWQADHSLYALASGGFFGQGLGGSREKWSYLPEAHNDFIFAIIGEELGLPGTIGVLALIAVIGVACVRIIHHHDDYFVKFATAGIFTWIVGQALVNIAVVVGLLPVLGVPLPLVSSGGSALVTTMCALGVLLAFARSSEQDMKEVPRVVQHA